MASADLAGLQDMRAAGVDGVILGEALFSGRVDLQEAVQALA